MSIPKRFLALACVLVFVGGCTANLYFPPSMFSDDAERPAMYARMLVNLNAVLANPRLRAAIPTESGERVAAQGMVLLRMSAAHCPEKVLQDRCEVWERLKERAREAGIRTEYVDFDRARDAYAEGWALRVRRAERLMVHGADRAEFDRYWGLYKYDSPTKTWDLAPGARTTDGRHRIERATLTENGWLWQLAPCMPALVLVRDGRATAYLCRTPPDEIKVPEWSAWAKAEWAKRGADRAAFDRDMASPITPEERAMGEKVAARIEALMGGFGK